MSPRERFALRNFSDEITVTIRSGDIQQFIALTDRHDVDLNAWNRDGHTPLIATVLKDNLRMFSHLFHKQAVNKYETDIRGKSALDYAVELNRLTMQMFLKRT